jgi:hypothetical protein
MRWKKFEREMRMIDLEGNRHDLYDGPIAWDSSEGFDVLAMIVAMLK